MTKRTNPSQDQQGVDEISKIIEVKDENTD